MILFGASGHGKVIADILKDNGITDIEFWDDAPKSDFTAYPVTKTPVDAASLAEDIIISVGVNATRKAIAERLQGKLQYQKAIHSSAILSDKITIGEGTVLMPGVIINVDSEIGVHCIINTASSIDHDCVVGDYAHVSPNATLCGNVTVGEGTHIGAGSVVIQGITIGKWCEVGAGAVVVRDVPDYATVVGNPARIIKIKKP